MMGMKRQVLENHGYMDEGWDISPSGVLICPHGHLIEDDGECPEGCESPILEMGLI